MHRSKMYATLGPGSNLNDLNALTGIEISRLGHTPELTLYYSQFCRAVQVMYGYTPMWIVYLFGMFLQSIPYPGTDSFSLDNHLLRQVGLFNVSIQNMHKAIDSLTSAHLTHSNSSCRRAYSCRSAIRFRLIPRCSGTIIKTLKILR